MHGCRARSAPLWFMALGTAGNGDGDGDGNRGEDGEGIGIEMVKGR